MLQETKGQSRNSEVTLPSLDQASQSEQAPISPLEALSAQTSSTIDRSSIQRDQRTAERDAATRSACAEIASQAESAGYQQARSITRGDAKAAAEISAQHSSVLAASQANLPQESGEQLATVSSESLKRGASLWTDAVSDASKLQVAMTGMDDEDKIFEILGKNTSPEKMQALKEAYQERYGRDLIEDLKYNLSGSDEALALALVGGNKIEIGAAKLLRATRGAGTDEAMIKDVYSSASAEEIRQIELLFNQRYSSWRSGWMVTRIGEIDSVLKSELSTADYNEIKGHREKAAYAARGLSPEAIEAAASIEKALSGVFNDDEAAALEALRKLTPEQRKQVSQAYSELHAGGSLETRLQGELSFEQWQEAHAYLTNDPKASVLSLKRAIADQNYDLTHELLSNTDPASLGMKQEDLRSQFKELTGSTVQAACDKSFYTKEAQALNSLVETGKVDQVLALQRAFIGYTSNAEEKQVVDILKGKSRGEIEDLSARYAERFPGRNLRDDIISNLGGREEFEALQAMNGEPETVFELKNKLHSQFEYESSGWLSGWGSEYTALKRDLANFDKLTADIQNPEHTSLRSLSPELALAVEVSRKVVESDFESYSAQRDLIADRATTVAVVVACTAATIATAGAGAPIWGVALAAGASSFATKLTIKSALRGRSYDTDEIALDAATSAVEGGAAFLGGAAGARALQASAQQLATKAALQAGTQLTDDAILAAEKLIVAQLARGLTDAAVSSATNAVGTGLTQGDLWEDGVQAGMQRLAISAASELISSGALSSATTSLGKLTSGLRRADSVDAATKVDAGSPTSTAKAGDIAGAATESSSPGSIKSTAGAAASEISESGAQEVTENGAHEIMANTRGAQPAGAPEVDSTNLSRANSSTTPDVEITPGKVTSVKLANMEGVAPGAPVNAISLGLSSSEPRVNVISRGLEMIGAGETNVRQQLKDLGISDAEVAAVARAMLFTNVKVESPALAFDRVFKTLENINETISKTPATATDTLEMLQRRANLTKGLLSTMDDTMSDASLARYQQKMLGVSRVDGKTVVDPKAVERYFELRANLDRISNGADESLADLAKQSKRMLERCEENLADRGLIPADYSKRLAVSQLSGPNNRLKLPDDYLTNSDVPLASGLAKDPNNLRIAIDSAWSKAERTFVSSGANDQAQAIWLRRQERLQIIANDLGVTAPHLDARYARIGAAHAERKLKTPFDVVAAAVDTEADLVSRQKAAAILIGRDKSAQERAIELGILKADTSTTGQKLTLSNFESNLDLTRPEVKQFLDGLHENYSRRTAAVLLIGKSESAQKRAIELGLLKSDLRPSGLATSIDDLNPGVDLTRTDVKQFLNELYDNGYQKFVSTNARNSLAGNSPRAGQLRGWDQMAVALGNEIPTREFKEALFNDQIARQIIARFESGETAADLAELVRRTHTQEAVSRKLVFQAIDNPRRTESLFAAGAQLGISKKQFQDTIMTDLTNLGKRGADTLLEQNKRWIPSSELNEQMNRIHNQVAAYERIIHSQWKKTRPGYVNYVFEKAFDDHYLTLPEPILANRIYDRVGNLSGQILNMASTRASAIAQAGTRSRDWLIETTVTRMNQARRLAAMAIAPRADRARLAQTDLAEAAGA